MKIIDAHLHFCPGYEYFDEIAAAAGHENTEKHLKEQYEKLEIIGGIVMGNHGLSLEEHQYPPFLRYCIGIDSHTPISSGWKDVYDAVELHLKRKECVGIKLYPGYNPVYISDFRYEPLYELAKEYKKPVAVHMGETAGSGAYLKYSHPLTLDEVAVEHGDVEFIMCHFGNPWLMDAAAVVGKNENVSTDLSGLLEGHIDMTSFFKEQTGYIEALKTWLRYMGNYQKIMFGTDWPLANLGEYVEFVKRLIPEQHWENIFWKNAARIYQTDFKGNQT